MSRNHPKTAKTRACICMRAFFLLGFRCHRFSSEEIYNLGQFLLPEIDDHRHHHHHLSLSLREKRVTEPAEILYIKTDQELKGLQSSIQIDSISYPDSRDLRRKLNMSFITVSLLLLVHTSVSIVSGNPIMINPFVAPTPGKLLVL